MAPPAIRGVTAVDVSPEETVSIHVYASGVSGTQGVEIRFVYDSGRVSYEGAAAGDVFPDAQVLTETGTDPPSVSLGIASMGGNASAATGLAASVQFRTKATFTGTTIRIVEARLGRDGQQDTINVNVAIELNAASSGPSADFDADGAVGFSDFLQFAAQYGTTAGDGTYEARFDLDSDGSVGFADFLVLAGQFGQEVAPSPHATPNRDALVALYNATEGHNWTTQHNWLTESPIERWHGVTVEDGRVAGLVLSQNNLTGEIPLVLVELTDLDSLKLDRNALSGSIPVELADLSRLTQLELWANQLSGPIPVQLGDLRNLTMLHLAFNLLDGSIPEELGRLEHLEGLLLTRNQLTGEIPDELANLSNLESLWLNGNQLSGPIPPGLGNLTNLWGFALAGNQLTGSIPAELGNLKKAERFFLGFNQLTGPIPAELGQLTSLPGLSLNHNSLSGPIPPELGNLANLENLDLNNNDLSGPIPIELGKLSKLKYLRVNNNESLTGALPQSLTRLTEMLGFYFAGTGLCAPLDSTFQTWLQAIKETSGPNCPQ